MAVDLQASALKRNRKLQRSIYIVYHDTNIAACSVVETDCLTGDHGVLKTDIVMYVGRSLNPAIGIKQIKESFVQGHGLFVMEQMIHSPSGVPLTRGTGAYKIPDFDDIPAEIHVTLLKGTWMITLTIL